MELEWMVAAVWIAGLPLIGATFHVAWCVKHQINPLTAEPRDRYYQLRGWAWQARRAARSIMPVCVARGD